MNNLKCWPRIRRKHIRCLFYYQLLQLTGVVGVPSKEFVLHSLWIAPQPAPRPGGKAPRNLKNKNNAYSTRLRKILKDFRHCELAWQSTAAQINSQISRQLSFASQTPDLNFLNY